MFFLLLACVTCEILFVCSASIFFFPYLLFTHSSHTVSHFFLFFLCFGVCCCSFFFDSLLVELIRLREKEKVNNNNKIRNTCKILKNLYAYSAHCSILRHWIIFHPPHLYLSSTSNYRIRMDRISLFNPLFFYWIHYVNVILELYTHNTYIRDNAR